MHGMLLALRAGVSALLQWSGLPEQGEAERNLCWPLADFSDGSGAGNCPGILGGFHEGIKRTPRSPSAGAGLAHSSRWGATVSLSVSSVALMGLHNAKPWIWSHPSSRSVVTWSAVSAPSATAV